jgi:hypothetical protein
MIDIWNRYLDGTLYSWDTMMGMCIGVAFTGCVILFMGMVKADRRSR